MLVDVILSNLEFQQAIALFQFSVPVDSGLHLQAFIPMTVQVQSPGTAILACFALWHCCNSHSIPVCSLQRKGLPWLPGPLFATREVGEQLLGLRFLMPLEGGQRETGLQPGAPVVGSNHFQLPCCQVGAGTAQLLAAAAPNRLPSHRCLSCGPDVGGLSARSLVGCPQSFGQKDQTSGIGSLCLWQFQFSGFSCASLGLYGR